MKPIQVRCSKSRKTKKGEQVRCSRFIAIISDYEVAIKCPRCKTWYKISREVTGKYKIVGVLNEKYSDSLNMETNNVHIK